MFPWFRKKESAKVAKDRLQIAIMTDRANVKKELPFLDDLKRDIIEVIKKYTKVSSIEIRKESDNDTDAIAINIELE